MALADRLRGGLSRTREILTTPLEDLVRGRRPLDAAALESVEEALLAADMGVSAVQEAMEVLEARSGEIASGGLPAMRSVLRQEIRRALAAESMSIQLADLERQGLDRLIERYVRSEIYYREALAMGLGQDDPYVRNRLALKLEVLLDDLSAGAEPADEELARFLAEHAERFADPERLSFRQVYVSSERSPDPAVEARRVLELLQGGEDPDRFGDVSMLAARFDGASPADVKRVFGGDFVDALAELEPGAWQGPVRSPFGLHLVRIAERVPARLPALEEIRDAVLAEWRDQQRRDAREQAYERLRERYDVVIEPATPDGTTTPESR